MSRPERFLIRMIVFLVAVAGFVGALGVQLYAVFLHNPFLNGVILFSMLIGVVYALRRVLVLRSEIEWMRKFRRVEPGLSPLEPPTLLAPIATMLTDREREQKVAAISPTAARTLLDSLASRLDESREISRYLSGLLIFLGLLGTFWGLLETVSAVGGTIRTLNPAGADFQAMFADLQRGLQGPLGGMGTAFGSSLFGLAGSLVLGFLDLQAGQAQNQFFNDVDEWLAGITRAGGGIGGEGESVPAYVQALLEQTAEGLRDLQRVLQRGEERAAQANQAAVQLSDKIALLADQMKSEQDLLVKLAENQLGLAPILQRLSEAASKPDAAGGLDAATKGHLRNLDVNLGRLIEESARGRDQLIADLRGEVKLLARTIAARPDRERQG